MYEYHARLLQVVDGDTVDLDIDLGCFVRITRRCRLRGINAPEMKGQDSEEGKVSRLELEKILNYSCDSSYLLVRTHLDRGDKYGRLLVDILCGESTVNEIMVAKGCAVRYMQ